MTSYILDPGDVPVHCWFAWSSYPLLEERESKAQPQEGKKGEKRLPGIEGENAQSSKWKQTCSYSVDRWERGHPPVE